jgi:hypothetical protein
MFDVLMLVVLATPCVVLGVLMVRGIGPATRPLLLTHQNTTLDTGNEQTEKADAGAHAPK